MLFDKKTGNKIASYDRFKTDDFCLRAVVEEKTTSRVFSEEKIMFKDAIKEAQRVLLREHRSACIAQKFLSSSKGEKAVEAYLEQFKNKRIDYLKEVFFLNHLEMDRCINDSKGTESYAEQIKLLDEKIKELEAQIKKLKAGLTEKNEWIVLFTQPDFKNNIRSLKFRKYVNRFDCIDFKQFELTPQNKEARDLIPAEWRGDIVWQEKAEKTQSV